MGDRDALNARLVLPVVVTCGNALGMSGEAADRYHDQR